MLKTQRDSTFSPGRQLFILGGELGSSPYQKLLRFLYAIRGLRRLFSLKIDKKREKYKWRSESQFARLEAARMFCFQFRFRTKKVTGDFKFKYCENFLDCYFWKVANFGLHLDITNFINSKYLSHSMIIDLTWRKFSSKQKINQIEKILSSNMSHYMITGDCFSLYCNFRRIIFKIAEIVPFLPNWK